MGHESRIELWSPNLTAVLLAGFGTDRLSCEEAMKTAGRENPNRRANVSCTRAHGADGQNKSCSIQWAAKQEKVRPMQKCFFLTSTFIELTRRLNASSVPARMVSGPPYLILPIQICFSIDNMEPEWSVRSKKNAWVFVRETFLYGFVISVLLASVRWVWHLSFTTNLFEIWAVSTVVLAPLVCAGKRLFINAFKW